MRDWEKEKEKRVAFIKNMLATSGAKGIVFGNSGGKDSALVAALCSFATDNDVTIADKGKRLVRPFDRLRGLCTEHEFEP